MSTRKKKKACGFYIVGVNFWFQLALGTILRHYQNAVQVGGVDDVTDGLDALDELAEVSHHVLPLDDLGVARESGWQQALVDQWFEAHHDGVICQLKYVLIPPKLLLKIHIRRVSFRRVCFFC